MTGDLWVKAVISVKSVSWVGDGAVSGVSLSVVSSSDDKNGETPGNVGIWPDDGSSDGSDSASDAVHVHSILSNLIVESFTIPKRRNFRRSKQIVEPELQTIVETPVATMADTRTMSELLQAPTEGYEDAVIPAILAENFELKVSFANALLYISKFASTFKSLLSNKEKLFVLDLEVCLALADIGASINLMPLFVLKKLSLMELTPTRMTLKLANQSVAYPVGVAKDVFVKVGKFYFPADFVVVDYDVDPRVPLIPERPFLRTERALIDVHGEELTLRVNDEAITFKEYAQEVLGFSDSSTSGNPTPSYPIIASSSPSFTPFEGGDFILEEIDTFLRTSDELFNLDGDYYDTEGDILYLKKLLNKDPSLNLPPMKNEDLKEIDITMTKPLIEEPSELELNDLPSHLEYAF
nr:hypothetical protein [Tanacetum cinerariifolium]